MGEVTEISWAQATFNPWIGCTKVSPGCANCYAETLMDTRWGKVKWGKGQTRQRTSEANWRQPLTWNRKAEKAGTRLRVFCASLADWLDAEAPAEFLADLLALIARTPALDWMLLTKRPELWRARLEAVMDLAPASLVDAQGYLVITRAWLDGFPPANVWVGTTVEDQKRAEERLPAVLRIPARVRFLSCEPLLGPIDIARVTTDPPGSGFAVTDGFGRFDGEGPSGIHWIIAGGESGHHARPMHPTWVRSLRDQAQAAGVAFHFKQWGEWCPAGGVGPTQWAMLPSGRGAPLIAGRHGARIDHAALGLPPDHDEEEDRSGLACLTRAGKGVAGRELDGRTWDELPAVAHGA